MVDVEEVSPLGKVSVLHDLSSRQDGTAGEACLLSGGEDLRPRVGVEPRLGYGGQLAVVLGPAFGCIEPWVVYEVWPLDHPGEIGPHSSPQWQEAHMAVAHPEGPGPEGLDASGSGLVGALARVRLSRVDVGCPVRQLVRVSGQALLHGDVDPAPLAVEA